MKTFIEINTRTTFTITTRFSYANFEIYLTMFRQLTQNRGVRDKESDRE